MLADAALLFIGFLLANYIRFNYVRYFEPGGAGPALAVARDSRNIIAGLATSLVLVLIYWVAGIYSTTRLRGLAERCTKIAVINAAGLLIFIGALYLMHLDDYSRIVLALFYILGTAGVRDRAYGPALGRPRPPTQGAGSASYPAGGRR